MLFAGGGLFARGFDQMMRVALADLFRQRECHRLRHDQPMAGVEIEAHARDIDFQPFRDVDNGRQRA